MKKIRFTNKYYKPKSSWITIDSGIEIHGTLLCYFSWCQFTSMVCWCMHRQLTGRGDSV